MPFKKGQPKIGGRKKGSVNLVTRTVKEAIQYALDENSENLVKWLESAGKKSGGQGIFAYTALAEFVQPKLSRSEVTGPEGKDLAITVTRTVISKKI